jgi:hypothetical protein
VDRLGSKRVRVRVPRIHPGRKITSVLLSGNREEKDPGKEEIKSSFETNMILRKIRVLMTAILAKKLF